MDHPNLIVVQSYGTRPEAELAKTALEDAGIPAMIQADSVGGMRDHLAWSGEGFRIFVREEDVSVAHDVLTPPPGGGFAEEFERDAAPPTWRRFT